MTTTVETIRYMQTRTFKAPLFVQKCLEEAGVTARSVKSISQLINKLGDEAAIKAATAVFQKHSRAHSTFRSMASNT